ncbi:hypothetical protein [Candidatus Amarolinea dominans]|uniref:hypothetical protein n=1 Tax=Candidatus Amarolinea dominans TaxID=3140696 RepID=UPI0031CC7562
MPKGERLHAAGLCDACQLFGATGWRRRFQLRVEAQTQPAWEGGRSLNVRPYGRTRGWFLNPGHLGTIKINLTGDAQTLGQMLALFCFLERWGSLGARSQLGYGIFKITGIEGTETPTKWNARGDAAVGALPDLRSFTFFRLRFVPREANWWAQVSGLRELRSRRDLWPILEHLAAAGMAPVMPAIKNHLRYEQQWSSVTLPPWLFGTLYGGERMRSKVALGWAFRLEDAKTWEIRGWVHLPNDARSRAGRAEVTTVLRRALATRRTGSKRWACRQVFVKPPSSSGPVSLALADVRQSGGGYFSEQGSGWRQSMIESIQIRDFRGIQRGVSGLSPTECAGWLQQLGKSAVLEGLKQEHTSPPVFATRTLAHAADADLRQVFAPLLAAIEFVRR